MIYLGRVHVKLHFGPQTEMDNFFSLPEIIFRIDHFRQKKEDVLLAEWDDLN